ncbi:flavin monoamine oxidase family protein [Polluticoccus soli]|uniref:flavin monoamine oxidase family protein n=1 Tax=Polluticoccus soli TaxID=3034150 RepID=UPI0023E12FE8|nr:NAD(P)/FAD-dependent oxidoreductase [Flavipsychrobacter sp. JY13-12]
MKHDADAIVVGAGAAGLMAAWHLAQAGRKVLIVEANDKPGGRINTLHNAGFSHYVEAGAEFVHGELPFTLQLLKEAGIEYTPMSGELLQYKKGEIQEQHDLVEHNERLKKPLNDLAYDMPVEDFLNKYFPGVEDAAMRQSVKRFIEGYEAADAKRASIIAMKEDLMEDDSEQFRVEGGYGKMIDYLVKQCDQNGCMFRYSYPVKHIHWSEGNVRVDTPAASYHAQQVLLTVPISILQAEPNEEHAIRFLPSLERKWEAAKVIGAGIVMKFLLEFKTAFWKENAETKDMGFILSDEIVPTWWTQTLEGSMLLTGWLAGPNAAKLKDDDEDMLLDDALNSLSNIFKIPHVTLREQLRTWYIANWQHQPFIKCAYSYATVGSKEAKEELNKPESSTIFFAGEATYIGQAAGTVEAALASAVNVVKEMLNHRPA